jgi:hypothetical protein
VFNHWVERLGRLLSFNTGEIPPAAQPVDLLPTPPAQFSMSLSDCTVGLNPLTLQSRGLLLVTSTTIRGQWDFKEGGRGKFDANLNKIHLFCIDIASNLLLPPTRQTRLRFSGRKEVLGYFTVRSVLRPS